MRGRPRSTNKDSRKVVLALNFRDPLWDPLWAYAEVNDLSPVQAVYDLLISAVATFPNNAVWIAEMRRVRSMINRIVIVESIAAIDRVLGSLHERALAEGVEPSEIIAAIMKMRDNEGLDESTLTPDEVSRK